MEKSPAFQFYPADWLDFRVLRMSLAAQGAYIRLLCHMWRDSKDQCSIEAEPSSLSILLGVSQREFHKLMGEIQREADPILLQKDGRYISRRLQKEKAQQVRRRREKSEAGSKGAKTRWQSHASAKPQPIAKDASSSSSSSAIASSSSPAGEYVPPAPRGDSIEELLSARYIASNPGVISREKAISQIKFALARGAKPPDLEAAFMDPKAKGKKIWEIIEQLTPTQNGKRSIEEVMDEWVRKGNEKDAEKAKEGQRAKG